METPGCHPGAPMLSANFKLDSDISPLFPYINAVVEDSQYFDKPRYIRFTLNGVRWALYPDYGSALPFETLDQAREYLDDLITFLNDLYERKETITPDTKVYKPVPVMDIYRLLPGTNCRECQFAACMAFAAALSKGEVPYSRCPQLADPEKEKALLEMGVH